MSNVGSTIWNTVKNIGSELWNSIKRAISGGLGGAITEGGKNLWDAAKGVLGLANGGTAEGGTLEANIHSIGPGRLVRVNEEGHDEVIIPLAPHRRDRARSLLAQTAGRLLCPAGIRAK